MWKLQGSIKHSLNSILNLLYLSDCPICKNPSDSLLYAPLCSKCWSGIKRHSAPICEICSRPLIGDYGVCGECRLQSPFFSKAISYGIYSGTLKEAISLFKFSGIKRLGRPLGRLLQELTMPQADFIIPVPMEVDGLINRGFNQALVLSREVSKTFKIPILIGMLYKKRKTPPQVGLGADERVLNLKGAFGVKGDLYGKKILLLDDVMTTGATVNECSNELLRAGAGEIVVIVLARAE